MQKNGAMQEGGEVHLLQIYHYEPTLLHWPDRENYNVSREDTFIYKRVL